jgi:hypothetical protein
MVSRIQIHWYHYIILSGGTTSILQSTDNLGRIGAHVTYNALVPLKVNVLDLVSAETKIPALHRLFEFSVAGSTVGPISTMALFYQIAKLLQRLECRLVRACAPVVRKGS